MTVIRFSDDLCADVWQIVYDRYFIREEKL